MGVYHLVQPHRLRDLVSNGEDGVERCHRFLEDHGHLVSPDAPHLVTTGIESGDVDELAAGTAIEDLAGLDLSPRPRHQLHHRQGRNALSTTALADDSEGLASADFERDVVDGLDDSIFGVKKGLQVRYGKQRLVCSLGHTLLVFQRLLHSFVLFQRFALLRVRVCRIS